MESTRPCSRGDWALQGWRLGEAKVKANFSSRAFYTWLVGISVGVLDTQQGSRGDWAGALRFLELGKQISVTSSISQPGHYVTWLRHTRGDAIWFNCVTGEQRSTIQTLFTHLQTPVLLYQRTSR